MNALGEHMLLEYYGCDAIKLAHSDEVKEIVVNAVRQAHGTVVTNIFHNFSPHGVSGVVVIAESHVTIHTWPEHACAAVDIFSCSARLDKTLLRDMLKEQLGASEVTTRNFERGLRIPDREASASAMIAVAK
jgi:S-adenosylmethionine decarboxylase